jgi:hypothetical protein
MIETKIINLFAGPGAGKSTIASGLFYDLKKQNISCDIPYEFPKELAWEESKNRITDQFYVIANQHRGIVRSYGKVEYIILDSPILLSLIYKNNYTTGYPSSLYKENFDKTIIDIHKSYENINIFLNRPKNNFKNDGRFHSKDESDKLDKDILTMLKSIGEKYLTVDVNNKTIKNIENIIKLWTIQNSTIL